MENKEKLLELISKLDFSCDFIHNFIYSKEKKFLVSYDYSSPEEAGLMRFAVMVAGAPWHRRAPYSHTERLRKTEMQIRKPDGVKRQPILHPGRPVLQPGFLHRLVRLNIIKRLRGWFGWLLLLLLCLSGLSLGAWFLYGVAANTFAFWHHGIEKSAVVIELDHTRRSRGGTTNFYYTIEVDGQRLTQRFQVRLPVGERISVLGKLCKTRPPKVGLNR